MTKQQTQNASFIGPLFKLHCGTNRKPATDRCHRSFWESGTIVCTINLNIPILRGGCLWFSYTRKWGTKGGNTHKEAVAAGVVVVLVRSCSTGRQPYINTLTVPDCTPDYFPIYECVLTLNKDASRRPIYAIESNGSQKRLKKRERDCLCICMCVCVCVVKKKQ